MLGSCRKVPCPPRSTSWSKTTLLGEAHAVSVIGPLQSSPTRATGRMIQRRAMFSMPASLEWLRGDTLLVWAHYTALGDAPERVFACATEKSARPFLAWLQGPSRGYCLPHLRSPRAWVSWNRTEVRSLTSKAYQPDTDDTFGP